MTNYYGKPSAPPRLVGRLLPRHISMDMQPGVYIDGEYQGEANGWYNANIPGLVPVGLWDSSGSRTDANGLYENNVRITLTNGLWVAEVYQGEANGWYQNNLPAAMNPGLWVDNTYIGIVNGWYVNNTRTTLLNGLWVDEIYQGAVNGWYVDNALAVMATGIWEGNAFREIATGLYDNNVKLPFDSGLYVDGSFVEIANNYYVNNERAPIPDGCYRGGGLVDPYYERIRDAALAEGGGLYLFQLEHGKYAGEQVIWQEMGELTPWVPGLLTPQGKTYDLMGSGEYLGQSVSMRRPIDGVFDGVSSAMVASSDAVGGTLHYSDPIGGFIEHQLLSGTTSQVYMATAPGSSASTSGFYLMRSVNGFAQYAKTDGVSRYAIGRGALGLVVDGVARVGGFSRGFTGLQFFVDGVGDLISSITTPWPSTPASQLLCIGRATPTSGAALHAKITYIAIYTREPTPYEISLHKRTP